MQAAQAAAQAAARSLFGGNQTDTANSAEDGSNTVYTDDTKGLIQRFRDLDVFKAQNDVSARDNNPNLSLYDCDVIICDISNNNDLSLAIKKLIIENCDEKKFKKIIFRGNYNKDEANLKNFLHYFLNNSIISSIFYKSGMKVEFEIDDKDVIIIILYIMCNIMKINYEEYNTKNGVTGVSTNDLPSTVTKVQYNINKNLQYLDNLICEFDFSFCSDFLSFLINYNSLIHELERKNQQPINNIDLSNNVSHAAATELHVQSHIVYYIIKLLTSPNIEELKFKLSKDDAKANEEVDYIFRVLKPKKLCLNCIEHDDFNDLEISYREGCLEEFRERENITKKTMGNFYIFKLTIINGLFNELKIQIDATTSLDTLMSLKHLHIENCEIKKLVIPKQIETLYIKNSFIKNIEKTNDSKLHTVTFEDMMIQHLIDIFRNCTLHYINIDYTSLVKDDKNFDYFIAISSYTYFNDKIDIELDDDDNFFTTNVATDTEWNKYINTTTFNVLTKDFIDLHTLKQMLNKYCMKDHKILSYSMFCIYYICLSNHKNNNFMIKISLLNMYLFHKQNNNPVIDVFIHDLLMLFKIEKDVTIEYLKYNINTNFISLNSKYYYLMHRIQTFVNESHDQSHSKFLKNDPQENSKKLKLENFLNTDAKKMGNDVKSKPINNNTEYNIISTMYVEENKTVKYTTKLNDKCFITQNDAVAVASA